jgi:MscS family membrane protein
VFFLNDKLPNVYIEKINNKWFYSQTTVDAIPYLHKQVFPFGSNIWAKYFPYKKNEKILKFYIWQWIGIGIITAVFLFCIFLLKYIFRIIFNKILFRKYINQIHDMNKMKLLSNLFSAWVGVKVLQTFVPTLFINTKYAVPIIKGISFIAALIIVYIIFKAVELIIFYALQYVNKTDNKWDDQIVVVLQKFLKFITIFLGLFYVLNTLDVNLATIIAGLSVGGLALALAAQDTVKNFIASVMIFIDRPFKIGDLISGDNFEGIVQEVGFRSTRLKTGNDSIVYIANAKLSEMTIDNKGFNAFKKFKTDLYIPYNTSLHTLNKFIETVRAILIKHPYTKNSTIDVVISNITLTGIIVHVSYTYKIFSQKEEYKHREFILLQILEVANILGIKLFHQTNETKNDQTNQHIQHYTIDEMKTKIDNYFEEFNVKLKSNTIQNEKK